MSSVDKKFLRISLTSQSYCHQNTRQQAEEMVNMHIMKEEMGGGSIMNTLVESWKMLFPKVRRALEC